MTQTLTPAQAATLLAEGTAVLIDVREPDEFAAEHIPHALSLPLGQLAATFPLLNLPKNRTVIFQCRTGKRAGQACELMTAANLPIQIHTIEGGIEGWKAATLPTITQGSTISIFRQVQMVVGSLIALLVVIGFMGISLAFILAGIFAVALATAGATGWCGLALLLKRMPWNR